MISVKSDLAKLAKTIPRAFRKQIPFATSQALNDTARIIATKTARSDMDSEISNPRPWTKTGLRYKRSNKANLTSEVYITPERWAYLKYIINGRTRRPEGRAIAIATGKRNQYGNKPRGWISKQAARANTFWGEVGGRYGLWERGARGRLKLLAYTAPQAEYTQTYNYARSVDNGVRDQFNGFFKRRIEAAIRTAK